MIFGMTAQSKLARFSLANLSSRQEIEDSTAIARMRVSPEMQLIRYTLLTSSLYGQGGADYMKPQDLYGVV